MKTKIAITTTSFAKYDETPLRLLREKGFEVVMNPYGRKLDAKETLELCGGCVGIVAGTEGYGGDTLKEFSELRVISRCGVGTDAIDMDSVCKLGIKVFNTPKAPTLSVAELTVALILNLLRKVTQLDSRLKNGKWDKVMGNLLHGKKVGIIGFGRIGQEVARLISPFGVQLVYCDIQPKPSLINCPKMSFAQLLGWADIVTLHLSISGEKCPIIGRGEFKLMKRNSWLVNVSRGGAVDEKALYDVLKDGYLSGAAIDVFEREPYNGPLRELDNCLLTPHVGSYARESRIHMEKAAVENLIKGLTYCIP